MGKKTRTWQQLELVEVIWVDAALDSTHTGDLEDPASALKFGGRLECSDVGYLIRKDRKEVVLAVGICRADNTYRHSNTIPRGWIKKITSLSREAVDEKQREGSGKSAGETGGVIDPSNAPDGR